MGCGKSHSIINLNDRNEDEYGNANYAVKSFKWHLDSVTDLDIVQGHQVVSGSADGQIYLCDLTNVRCR